MSPTMTAKEQVLRVSSDLPDDTPYDEILRALAFKRMVERGLADVKLGRIISDEKVATEIESW